MKKVTLACTNCASRNYKTMKNEWKTDARLRMKKFCKTCKQHTLHQETK